MIRVISTGFQGKVTVIAIATIEQIPLYQTKKMFSLNSSQKLYDETGFRILALNILRHNLLVITAIKVPFLPDFIKA